MAAASPAEMLATLPGKTGRSVDEWIAALEASGAASGTHTEQREWLQSQGLGRNHAGAVLWWRKNGAAIQAGGDSLVDDQYSGRRAPLRPIYEELAGALRALGDDVEFLPRGTYVTFARGTQFAIAKPGSGRVDLGLRLPGVEPTERLLDAGSFGSGSITHRISLHDATELDDEVRELLRAAYDARG
jgi:predicted transport protein